MKISSSISSCAVEDTDILLNMSGILLMFSESWSKLSRSGMVVVSKSVWTAIAWQEIFGGVAIALDWGRESGLAWS